MPTCVVRLCRLQVEESGIITLNKFLENKEGESNPKGVEQYIDPGAPYLQGPSRVQMQLQACKQPNAAASSCSQCCLTFLFKVIQRVVAEGVWPGD